MENDFILCKMYLIFNNVIFLFESKLLVGVIGLYIYFFDIKLLFYKKLFCIKWFIMDLIGILILVYFLILINDYMMCKLICI